MAKFKTGKKLVEETHNLWRDYSNKRETWAKHAVEDKEFRLGRQWTTEQRRVLQERGQAPVVVNRIHPAVESAKALLTANRPSFRVSPREDSDNRVAQVFNGLLEYCWDVSDGLTALRNVVDDYYVMGMGCMQVYQDPLGDMGKGEVKIKDIDPLDVYIDPNARDRMCDDAENIIISRLYTKEQAMKMYPEYEKKIRNANSDVLTDKPITGREDDGEIKFPEDVATKTDVVGYGDSSEYVRGYERYKQYYKDMYRVYQKWDGGEDLLDDVQFEEYLQRPAWQIEDAIITDPQIAEQAIEQMEAIFKQQSKAHFKNPQQVQAPIPANIQEHSFADLIEMKQIEVVEVSVKRIYMCVIMGDQHLYSRELPCEDYPLVFFMNMHTRTPYPLSDVRMVKGMQEYINKTRSLIIAHATTSTNVKILVPTGSVDMREFEQKWAQPGVAIEVDFDQGAPQPVQPLPLPNELYQNENTAKQDIDHQLGLYELMMGNSQAAPQTYKATVSIDEFGQRKIRSKLMDIEAGLKRAAECIIPMMQQLFTTEKIIRVVQPNNSISEYAINKRLFDDKMQEIGVMNDITVGKYDVVVVTGGTLPTNRFAQLELYMDAYRNGIIDKQEVLKKTEVFDMEGVLQRTDLIAQLQGQLQQAQESIKKLTGDLQTRDREAVQLRKKVEVEKFKTSLDQTSNKAKAANTVFEKRLDDATSQIRKEIQDAAKERTSEKSRSK